MTPEASDPDPIFEDRFKQLTEAVLKKRPILRELIRKRGQRTLFDYTQEALTNSATTPLEHRRSEFIGTFQHEVSKRLGATVAAEAAEQLRHYYCVSTTDHHGPLVNQSFVSANLVTAVPGLLKYAIVLSCANVSLNNISFPRGLIFTSVVNDQPTIQRLSFLPSNAHAAAVYNFRPYTSTDIEKIKKLLKEKVRQHLVTAPLAEQVLQIIEGIYAQPEVLDCPTYSDQVIKTNYSLWQRMLGNPAVVPTNLIYLEQELMVSRLLIEHHLYADTTITHWLFDPEYEPLIMQYFDGIMGAFSSKEGWGTYLFWGISTEKNFRVRLWRHGQELVSSDGSLRIPLTPGGIAQALEQQQIIPSLLTVFTVLCLYYGITCFGGFNQINYLTSMKNAYIKLMSDRGNYKSVEVSAHAQTKAMIDGFLLSFMRLPNGKMIPATGLDLALHADANTWPTIVNSAKQVNLAEALNPSFPEFYLYAYTEVERKAELQSISSEQIAHATGLDEKIKPCIVYPV